MREPVTGWKVQPSFKYDALCFLNALTGDPFYLDYYREEYEKWEPRLDPETRAALANLKRKMKDEGQQIISANLTLLFSASPARNLKELGAVVQENQELRQNFQKTGYYDPDQWQVYESVRADLEVIFKSLEALDFEGYWQQSILPQVEPQVVALRTTLEGYNIVPEIEKHLGFKLVSNEIVVDVLYYTKPHGIKLTGTEFITAGTWPANIVLGTAIHEMMHPPFQLEGNPALRDAIEGLRKDSFLMERFNNHNPAFGYNTLEGLIDEDCVQALDQLISERFGVAREPRKRWKDSDEGLHGFAVALYSVLKEQGYGSAPQNRLFQDHLLGLLQTSLQPGQIEPLYNRFYSEEGA